MRYCVIGAGAMGGMYGLRLVEAGYSVDFFDTNQEHVDTIKRKGFQLSGVKGDGLYRVNATADPYELENTADIVLFQAHTSGTIDAADVAALVLKPEGWAITLQNGIGNLEALMKALGSDRVVGGISYHSAELRGMGHTVHTNEGPTFLGEVSGDKSARVDILYDAFRKAQLSPELASDIMSVIWSKFIVNCGVNPVCAVSGLRSGEVARNFSANELQTKILEEIMQVVNAKGIKLSNNDMIGYVKKLTKSRYNKPSMQQHIDAGRLTEIDSLNGALVQEAKALDIAVPYNESLVLMTKAREAAMVQAKSGVEPDYAALEAIAEKEGN
ncbi:MAG: hypothetical protein CMM58_11325 [Rhodospirillaceae bacterium]|nr:hypothetical protein [Rhodospirillaceae bacterium]